MTLDAGQTLSHYALLGPLGAGAMGEVWRALDSRLGREVAIKVLPEPFAADDERLRRFEREARTLATLNHPNVAQVFEIDQVDDTCFIVMELVPGEDLAARLVRGALPLDEALDACRQIATGLEAAHEAGVVHRDLKPANVRITPDGQVKVLDFGLAKPIGPNADAEATSEAGLSTEQGRVLGTPMYMAPEQARGRPLDRRVDVWAFGCVLYECLTGRRAFEGESVSDVLVCVLERSPDLARLPAQTPVRVRRLLARCFDKDPRTRLRDIGEARVVLDDPDGELVPGVAEHRQPRSGLLAVAVLAASALTWLLAGMGDSEPRRPQNPLAGTRPRKLIDWPGTEFDASISRDGKLVSFASDRDGEFDSWVVNVEGGRANNITRGRHRHWALKVKDSYFDRHAANLIATGSSPRLFDILSGEVRPIPYDPEITNLMWSPDGSRMVYHLFTDGDPVFVADADGDDAVQISILATGEHQHYPTWSFDGEWIYVVRGFPAALKMDLWRMRPDGTAQEQLTFEQRDVGYPTPIDQDTVLFVGLDADGGGPWLWSLDLPSGEVIRAAIGVERYLSVAASLDGRRLVATVANPVMRLRTLPILDEADGVATGEDVVPLEALEDEHGSAPRYARDGTLFYLSGGAVMRLREGERYEVLASNELAAVAPPTVSPDGQRLAVVSRKDGLSRLCVVGVDGVGLETVAESLEARGVPAWSPLGDRLAIGGVDAEGEGLFVLPFPTDGSPPRKIVRGYALNPVWSPRDDLIVYNGPQVMAVSPLLGVHPDGTPVPLPEIHVIRLDERMRFLPDGSGLVYMQGFRTSQDFHLLDLSAGGDLSEAPTRQLTQLGGIYSTITMRTFDVDPSGERIVFDELQFVSDIVLIERDLEQR